jgi:hypothetical protein
MYDSRVLIEMVQRNFGVVKAHLEGVTHEQSLIQPPFNSNCLNWVVGHIVQNRNKMLLLLDQPTTWTDEQIERYNYGSLPVTDGHDALPLGQMAADLAVCNQRLVEALQPLTSTDLDAPGKEVIKGMTDWTVGWTLNFLIWHETYHTGQTDILRQASGKNDKII